MAARRNQVRRIQTETYSTSAERYYVDGNTVRKVQEREQKITEMPQQERVLSQETRRNREHAMSMNLRYVLFITAAAIITVAVCVNYLKLQSTCTTLQKTQTALETQLSSMKLENDAVYNGIMSSVDLEKVKDVAMNKLGMVYASASQIEYYEETENDYAKQYKDLP